MNFIKKIIINVKNVIKKIDKFFDNIIIWLFLTIISVGIVAIFVNIPIDYDTNSIVEYKDFIVNKRSHKIHIETCPSVAKMSERNKLRTNNSLENLINDGFYVCNRCKAGVKRKNEYIAEILENIENKIFGNDDINYKTYDEYLKSIDEMGEWYVQHVASYEGILYSDSATENANKYYETSRITKKGKLNCYICDNLKDCAGDYTKAGDDCVRFMFSCLNNMDKNYINLLSKISKYKWSRISSKLLNTETNQLQYAFINLGFEIYDVQPKKIDLNYDGYYDFEIFPIDSQFNLKKGDIISRDGHIHIYLSDNENFGWGKVNNIYPQDTATYIDRVNNIIVCNGEKFDRVYRYTSDN